MEENSTEGGEGTENSVNEVEMEENGTEAATNKTTSDGGPNTNTNKNPASTASQVDDALRQMEAMRLQMEEYKAVIASYVAKGNAEDATARNETDINTDSGSRRPPEDQAGHENPTDPNTAEGETQEAETMNDVPSQPG